VRVRRKIAPKNCAEKFARKKKKNGTGAPAENGKPKIAEP
jgi:hypothetical protein